MRRRTQVFLVGIMIAFVVLPVVTALADIRPRSLDEETEFELDESVQAYSVTYQVTTGLGRFQRDLTVDRPFSSAIVDGPLDTADGATDDGDDGRDGAVIVERRATLGLRGERSANGEWAAFTAAPTVAPGDTRLAVAQQIDSGERLTVLAAQEIADRACTLYRITQSPFDPGPLAVVDAAVTYSEVCIDAAGILLSWRDVVDRDTVSVGVAESVRINPPVDEDDFRPPDETLLRPPGAGGGLFQEITDDIAGEVDDVEVEWASVPQIWGTVDRRLTLRPGEADGVAVADITPRQVDVWIDDADAVWLEQGPDDTSIDITEIVGDPVLTPAGEGRLVASLDGNVLWLPSADGAVVRLTSTLPLERLRELLPLLRRS